MCSLSEGIAWPRNIAQTQLEAGDKRQALATLKHAMEVAQKIEDAHGKPLALCNIASALATEPVPVNKKDDPGPSVRRMKKVFTPKEKQLAKQIVEAMQGN